MKLLVVGVLLCCVAAQQSCETCPPGNYIETLTGLCTPCPVGHASQNPDQTSTGGPPGACLQCPERQGTNMDQSKCVDCPAGKLSNAGVCLNCPAGRYQPFIGVNDTYGNFTNCMACPLGSRPNNDMSGCDLCPAGTYSSSGSVCTPCSATYYSKGIGQTYNHCTRCGWGFEPNALLGATDCQICTPGKYSTNGRACLTCGLGTYNNKYGATATTDCMQCSAGRAPNMIYVNGVLTAVGSKCDLCAPGKYSQDGSYCYSCSSGYNPDWGAQNTGACRTCPLGHMPNWDRTACTACPAGKYSDNGQYCTDCPINTTQPKTAAKAMTDCWNCPAGKVHAYDNAYPCICESGQYEVTSQTTPCLQCPIGKTSVKRWYDTTCEQWYGGTVIDAAPDGCTSCPPGKYGFVDSSSGTSYGYCLDCADGTFNPNTGSTSVNACQDCTDGYISRANWGSNLANCTQCAGGTYADTVTRDACYPCSAGTFSSATGATSFSVCATCMAGTYSYDGATSCRNCPAGTFSLPTFDNCAPCDRDTFSNVTGISNVASCMSCPSGRALLREAAGRGHWVPGPWRNCSASCETTRDVVCANTWLQQIPDSECLGSAKPATWAVCEGDPSYKCDPSPANRCPRYCSDNFNMNPARTYTCPDGTCVVDANDCQFGNRFFFKKRINVDVEPLYKTSPQAVMNWVWQYEGLFNQGFQNYAQVRLLLLKPVTWRNIKSVEVTFQIQQAPYPDNMYLPGSNNYRATNEIGCYDRTTAAQCYWECENNSTCVALSWSPGVTQGCCLASATGSTFTIGWSYYTKQSFPRYIDTWSMRSYYANREYNGGSGFYTTVTGLDPTWGWDWAPTPAPFSTNSASSVSMSMIGLLQVLSLSLLLKLFNAI